MNEELVPGLKEAVEARRLALGLTATTFADAAGVKLQGLAPLRKGYRRRYQDRLKLGVCRALRWTPDSIDRLLRGEPPVELDDGDDIGMELSRVEERVGRLERLLEGMLRDRGIDPPAAASGS